MKNNNILVGTSYELFTSSQVVQIRTNISQEVLIELVNQINYKNTNETILS